MSAFRLGINYWPISSAMYWWQRFNASEVLQDFAAIRSAGFDSVRIFMLWEDFQPQPEKISREAIVKLKTVADIANDSSLSLVPTFFTGHMSGVNWIPEWALESQSSPQRFRIVARNRVVNATPKNWYTNHQVLASQALLVAEIADALRDCKCVWAWDLGNENSNCVVPPNRGAGLEWLELMTTAIRAVDRARPITIGLHMEDLEEDRKLGPAEAAQFCDFLCMHGYPLYANWSRGPKDALLLPFLGLITRWLGQKDVLFEEFGAPTLPRSRKPAVLTTSVTLLTESEAAEFTSSALTLLKRYGLMGGFWWCYGDYDQSLWNLPPFDEAVHERYFGLWRSDRSEKPAVGIVADSAAIPTADQEDTLTWINIKRHEFYVDPAAHLRQLYQQFQQSAEQAY